MNNRLIRILSRLQIVPGVERETKGLLEKLLNPRGTNMEKIARCKTRLEQLITAGQVKGCEVEALVKL